MDGRALSHAASAAALQNAPAGWTFIPRAFGGVTVKLAPQDGTATVNLSLR